MKSEWDEGTQDTVVMPKDEWLSTDHSAIITLLL